MPHKPPSLFQKPVVGALVAIGAAMWAAFLEGDLGRFVTVPAIVFVLAIGQVIYGLIHERNGLRQQLDDKEVRIGLARQLGRLLRESDGLQSLNKVHPDEIIHAFDTKVETFLTEEQKLGIDYVARYRSGAGISITIPAGLSPAHQTQWCHMHTKRARLGEFIKELRAG